MEKSLGSTTVTEMNTGVPDFSVSNETLDTSETQEFKWNNADWTTFLGYYKKIPELKEAIRALARWTVGLGFETDNATQVMTDNITGWGEDSFQSIITNMIIIKKVNGDAFAEIIRNEKTGTLVNLKPLNPQSINIIVDRKGIILRYEEILSKDKVRTIDIDKMFHLCNDRVANEIHGISVIEAVKWVIDARNEAMNDWRRISHRSTIRVLYIEADDKDRLTLVKEQYKEAIKNGELLIMPAKKGEADLEDFTIPPIQPFIEWIRYLEGFFYQAVGVPKVIANTADFTEAASKVGFLTFQPVYTEEQTLLEQDLWNQLAIRVKFNRPPSLTGVVQEEEQKNAGQMGFQPTDTEATAGRVE